MNDFHPDYPKAPFLPYVTFSRVTKCASAVRHSPFVCLSYRRPTHSSPPTRSAASWSSTWPLTPSGRDRASPGGSLRPGELVLFAFCCPDASLGTRRIFPPRASAQLIYCHTPSRKFGTRPLTVIYETHLPNALFERRTVANLSFKHFYSHLCVHLCFRWTIPLYLQYIWGTARHAGDVILVFITYYQFYICL